MNERAVFAAVERIVNERHGLFVGTGEPCSMVPNDAIEQLAQALDAADAEPAPAPEAPASTWPDPDARPSY